MIRKSRRVFIAFIVLPLMMAPAFAQSPDEVTALLNQGEALVHEGQLIPALELFEKAELRFPNNPEISVRSWAWSFSFSITGLRR